MALTDTAVRNAKPKNKPYKVTDGQGLYLLVNPGGSKLWRVKYRRNGVERKLALGSYPEITFAEARSARDAARRQLAHDVDPNAAKRQARIEASNLRAVQILLGHSKIENTVRYLGIDVEDALALAENTEI